MAETNIITQEDFEKNYKKGLFNRIDYLCSSQTTLLSTIKESEEHLDLDVVNELPNLGITFNNNNEKLDSLLNLEREKCNAFYTANPIKRFSLMARSLIALPPESDFSCSLEDIFELNSYALTYIRFKQKVRALMKSPF